MIPGPLVALAGSGLKKVFGFLQQIGKSLMLPVSVLPVAGILLGVGSSKFSWLPVLLSSVMAQSGDAIFSNLPLIFAIGVALGLTGNDGVSALAAVVGYYVLLATMGVMGASFGLELKPVAGMQTLQTGVFGGILAGAMAAYLFNRFYRIELPPYLGFFAGKRFVPIITALSAVVLGVVMSVCWPPIQQGIHAFSNYAAYGNPHLAVFLYGTVERLLIPFGLHHIWNVPFFFEMGSFTEATGKVVHGDITRFFAGDPQAGILGGAFLFKMWGLPAAAIAMWHSARPERKAEVGGIMVSAALTSFLTGITEPIEFAFLFLAPVLYVIHALLAGSAFLVMELLGGKLGFTFSHGFIDFVLYYVKDTKPWLVLILGPLFALIYYATFRAVIHALDLKTPGREEVTEEEVGGSVGSLATQILEALGGAGNITSLDACITRLRVGLVQMSAAQPERLKQLGAAGVMIVGNNMQAIFGTRSENLKTDIEIAIRSGPAVAPKPVVAAVPAPIPVEAAAQPLDGGRTERLLGALGGASNVLEAHSCAVTRVRVKLSDSTKIDEAGLRGLGAYGVQSLPAGVFHLLVGEDSARWAASLTKKA